MASWVSAGVDDVYGERARFEADAGSRVHYKTNVYSHFTIMNEFQNVE